MNSYDFLESLLRTPSDLFVVVPRRRKELLASYQFCNIVYLEENQSRLVLTEDINEGSSRLLAKDLVRLLWHLSNSVALKTLNVCVPSKLYFSNIAPLQQVVVSEYFINPYAPYSGQRLQAVHLQPTQ